MKNNLTNRKLTKAEMAVLAFIEVHESNFSGCQYMIIPNLHLLNRLYHIDLIIQFPDEHIETYDIKDNMSFERNDEACFVGELKGVTGHKGSLYGIQDKFALMEKDMDDTFYIINRRETKNHVESKVNDNTEFVEDLRDAVYKKYQRTFENKQDVITLVPLVDLFQNGCAIQLCKNND